MMIPLKVTRMKCLEKAQSFQIFCFKIIFIAKILTNLGMPESLVYYEGLNGVPLKSLISKI